MRRTNWPDLFGTREMGEFRSAHTLTLDRILEESSHSECGSPVEFLKALWKLVRTALGAALFPRQRLLQNSAFV